MSYTVTECPKCGSKDSQRVIYQCTYCKYQGCWDKWGGGCWPKQLVCPRCGKNHYVKVADIKG